jgi:hypothetical protein
VPRWLHNRENTSVDLSKVIYDTVVRAEYGCDEFGRAPSLRFGTGHEVNGFVRPELFSYVECFDLALAAQCPLPRWSSWVQNRGAVLHQHEELWWHVL